MIHINKPNKPEKVKEIVRSKKEKDYWKNVYKEITDKHYCPECGIEIKDSLDLLCDKCNYIDKLKQLKEKYQK